MMKDTTKRCVLIFWLLWGITGAFAQKYQVDTLYKTGPLGNRINVVILGDGFTKDEMPKFVSEAKKFATFFRSIEPYNTYRNYFSFFAIETPSRQSGVTNPGTAPDAYPDQPVETKDTFFGATFGSFVHRAVVITKNDVLNSLLATHLPAYDLTVVLINTKFYGGTGGTEAVFTLHESAATVGMHEIGHTLGHLSDEYWGSGVFGREAANMTANSDARTIKWKTWLNTPSIGVYAHGSVGEAAIWNKPANGTCMMEYHEKQLCVVCREQIVERLLEHVSPIERMEPDTAGKIDVNADRVFKLGLLKPEPNTLEVHWRLNGQLLPASGEDVSLKAGQIPDLSVLTATVFDSTGMSRRHEMRPMRTHSVKWNLKSSVPGKFRIVASSDSLCAGEEVEYTAYGCPGTVSWSTYEDAQTIRIRPSLSGTYEAYCKVAGKPTLTAQVSVKVLPLPKGVIQGGGNYFVGQTIELNASGGHFYQWSGPRHFSADTPNIAIPNAGETNAGTYQVEITELSGCSSFVKTEVKVETILAVSNDPGLLVTVSPNPTREYISVETRLGGKSNIKLYDKGGREVYSNSFEKRTDIKLNLPAGTYLYRFMNGGRELSGKIAVQ